ncbi:MAG TPA: AMP-binding protein, partial [Polyangiaceae bacterium]|nr:AMP-binding protein [Polyangiaceae bacterium]
LDLAQTSSFELDPSTHQDESPAVPSDAVYVLFTSGSTGKPKGVTIEHRHVESFFLAHNERARINPGDRCLNTGPLYFDVFVLDVLLPLYRGAFVQLGPQLPIASLVLSMLERERITHVYAVGTVLGLITGNGDRLDGHDLSALRVLQTGAEVCNPAVVNHWLRRLPSLTFINSYGPTEVTVGCINFLKTSPGLLSGDVPIGTPHLGTKVALASRETGESVTAVGEIGELWLAGEQVMRGYLRRPLEERRALVMRAGVRYYRSGDLAYWDAEGNLHFAGRADDELKHCGCRIQPNEIRAILRACPGVQDAVVGVLAKSSPQQQIAAVLSIAKGQDSDHLLNAVMTHLKRHLPAYMHPTQFRLCDELTINQNGKCNVHSLFEQMEKELSR